MDKKPSKLARFIADRRDELNIASREELANKCGLKVTTIASIENGLSDQPRLETLKKLAVGLNVELALLMKMMGVKTVFEGDSSSKTETENYVTYLVTVGVPNEVAQATGVMLTGLIAKYNRDEAYPYRVSITDASTITHAEEVTTFSKERVEDLQEKMGNSDLIKPPNAKKKGTNEP